MKLNDLITEAPRVAPEGAHATLVKALKACKLEPKRFKLAPGLENEIIGQTVEIFKDMDRKKGTALSSYVMQLGDTMKLNGDVHNMLWALGQVKKFGGGAVNSELVDRMYQNALALNADIETGHSVFKSMKNVMMAFDAIENAATNPHWHKGDTLMVSIAKAALKKLGMGKYYGL